jgi:hypothetical protein
MSALFQLFKNFYRKDYGGFILVFLFFAVCLGLVYFTTDRFIALDDQFFHIRFAELIKERGFNAFRDFKWLYFSKVAQEQAYFENYHFLFYLFLLPFTFVSPLYLGIKLYGVIFGALAFGLLYLLLRKLEVKYPFFWTGLLFAAVSMRFLLRFINARPLTLAPVLLLLLFYLLYRKKYFWTLIISFLYLYWHSATFVFPLIVAAVYFVVQLITTKKTDWKIILYPLIGVGLAFISLIVFAPGFFQFMKDVTFNVIYRTIILGKEKLIEGTELYPADYFAFIRPNILFFVLLFLAWAGEIYRFRIRRPSSTLRLTLLGLTILFLIGTFVVRRNSDYFIFFAGAYIALAAENILTGLQFEDERLKKFLAGGAIAIMLFFLIDNLVTARYLISQARPHELIKPAALWLKTNVPKGKVVFNAGRDDFPTLFYYNPENYYVVGLEARLLYDYNPRLYWLWWHLTNEGIVCDQPECAEPVTDNKIIAKVLTDDFQTRYVLSTPQFPKLNRALSQNPFFKPVYADDYYVIFQNG